MTVQLCKSRAVGRQEFLGDLILLKSSQGQSEPIKQLSTQEPQSTSF